MKTENDFGVHWFRRDLRVAGNAALAENFRRHSGRVVGFFCFDPVFLSRSDFSVNRFAFFLKTLQALRDELRELGSDLLVVDRGPDLAFADLLQTLDRSGQGCPALVSWNRDYEPFARARDARLTDFFRDAKVETFSARDHLVWEPHEIGKGPDSEKGGEPYQIYTPFANRWMDRMRGAEGARRLEGFATATRHLDLRAAGGTPEKSFHLTWDDFGSHLREKMRDVLDSTLDAILPRVTVPLPAAGSVAAWRRLNEFADGAIDDYGIQRDMPAESGTSGLSIYLKNGSMTTALAIHRLGLRSIGALAAPVRESHLRFLKELIWREFYYHILFHHPRVESEAYQARFANLRWQNREDWFTAWCEGRTGFPIVDAGMRQLRETGWMHNRVRMIVASFLTKDLLIDWRWGEKYFMNQLLDGDLAPNNGGWQWAASTGCDPQPYFRIFSPMLQSKKFDPEATYIKRFVPELRSVNTKQIHTWSEVSAKRPSGVRYALPLVDHAVQRLAALSLYQVAK